MVRGVLKLLLVPLLGYAALCALLWLRQRSLVYFPGPAPGVTPADVGLPFERVELVASDGVRLDAWFLPAPEAPARGARAVLVCHGNAGSMEHRLPVAQAFREMGLAVLLFDYRGYGASAGSPSEQGLYRDAEAAFDHLVAARGFAPQRIVAYGESLGGAVAIELALRRDPGAVVAESCFTSLVDLGAELYRWIPVRLLARERFENEAKLARLRAPLLLIHSPDDEIVPFAHARRLLAAAGEPKELLTTGGGHNDGGFVLQAAWRARVAAFLAAQESAGG
jgi:fermentation-respiration switch protein FrsA (DUF1100 family)